MATLHARLHSELATTELKTVLAEDPRLKSLVENTLRRARELVEQRRVLEAQVWLAGITAIVERGRRERIAAKQRQEERIAALVTNLGSNSPAKDLGELLSHAATLQPDVTGKLLDVVEGALTGAESGISHRRRTR